ncbi:MAG: CoA pyrophosphatase [Cellvibrionaceae bacterium]
MIEHLRKNYAVERHTLEKPGMFPKQAGILIPVTDHPDTPEIILTRRADHLSSHAGEVSFPGGKWEEGDTSLVYTALRESNEEVALSISDVEVINAEPPMMSRWGLKVTPYVGIVPHDISLSANPDELAAIFRVPVSFFLEDRRTQTDVYTRMDEDWWCPVYHYEGFRIWGLTAKIIVEFMNNAWGADIQRESKAPEIQRKPLIENS